MNERILTANRLKDGLVIFLGYDGEWSVDINEARVAELEEDADDMLSEAKASGICIDAYLIDVTVECQEVQGRRIVPTKYRERIRSFGPSIHPAFAKQDVAEHFDPRADVSGVFTNGL